MKRKTAAILPSDYGKFLADIKVRVRAAQIRAGLAANRELLSLYWDLGRMILNRQKAQGWGAKVIDRLSQDLQDAFPGQQGFSPRNLKYMRAFAAAWPETLIVHQPGAQLSESKPPKSKVVPAPLAQKSRAVSSIVQQPVAQLPWGHHTVLLNKLATAGDRLWYAAKAIEQGWSRDVLALQIDSDLHARQGEAVTNFMATGATGCTEFLKCTKFLEFLECTKKLGEMEELGGIEGGWHGLCCGEWRVASGEGEGVRRWRFFTNFTRL